MIERWREDQIRRDVHLFHDLASRLPNFDPERVKAEYVSLAEADRNQMGAENALLLAYLRTQDQKDLP